MHSNIDSVASGQVRIKCKTKLSSKINWYGLCMKCMVSVETHFMILKNGGRPTKVIVSRVLLIL